METIHWHGWVEDYCEFLEAQRSLVPANILSPAIKPSGRRGWFRRLWAQAKVLFSAWALDGGSGGHHVGVRVRVAAWVHLSRSGSAGRGEDSVTCSAGRGSAATFALP